MIWEKISWILLGALTTVLISLRLTKERKLKDSKKCLKNRNLKEKKPFLILKTNQRSNSNLISEKKKKNRTQK